MAKTSTNISIDKDIKIKAQELVDLAVESVCPTTGSFLFDCEKDEIDYVLVIIIPVVVVIVSLCVITEIIISIVFHYRNKKRDYQELSTNIYVRKISSSQDELTSTLSTGIVTHFLLCFQ